jgi:putative addiction module killer protein
LNAGIVVTAMPDLREYVTLSNRSPYGQWFARLDIVAAAKIVTAVIRLAAGNTSNAKSIGEGVHELKVDFGPGYRVYFGWDGPLLVILLGGGTKKGQGRDIKAARACWRDYKVRKKAAG